MINININILRDIYSCKKTLFSSLNKLYLRDFIDIKNIKCQAIYLRSFQIY